MSASKEHMSPPVGDRTVGNRFMSPPAAWKQGDEGEEPKNP